MSIRRVQPGDRLAIRAADWNAVREMVQAYQQERLNAQGSGRHVKDDLIYGRNDTGADLARWSTAGIGGLVFLPADQGDSFGSPIVFTLQTPTLAHASRFAIAIEPIAAGAIGRLAVAGITVATVSNTAQLGSPTHAALADDGNGLVTLEAATSGPVELLWRDASSMSDLAVIRFGSSGGGGGTSLTTFRITGATRDGANWRWVYTGIIQAKGSPGYGGWGDADAVTHTLYNEAENGNGSTGTYGNGVNQSDLNIANQPTGFQQPGTYAIRQIPVGTIVSCKEVPVGAVNEWWIVGMPNGVTGRCPG
jgi:hypothetical protein